jgi:N-methylhydantoinase B/oxoprolinase/acetone carboxylase alpha subunit
MPDSGGPGEHRGGLSVTRTLEVVADEITLSCLFDRAKIPGWGLFGGLPGGRSQLLVKRVGDREFRTFVEAFQTVSPTKFTNVLLKRGDVVRYVTPGGGGYGDPLKRDAAPVLADVRNGWVSVEAALADYGVVIIERDGDVAVDEAATAAFRAARTRAAESG